MNDLHEWTDLESALTMLFPTPDETFLASLENDLRSRLEHIGKPTPSMSASPPLAQRIAAGLRAHRWASLTIGILLAILLSIVIIGPTRLASAWQRLSYYITGVGFVDVDQTLVLSAPVEDTRDGVTIRVEQVLAQPDRTVVVLDIEGLSFEEQTQFLYHSYLLLPPEEYVFRRLQRDSFSGSLDHLVLGFPQLPSGVRRLSLVWTDEFNLMLVRDGSNYEWETRFEAWTIPLTLRPASETEQTAFPFTYQPAGASDTQHGITIDVKGVSQDEELVAVNLGWRWPLGDHTSMAMVERVGLKDDAGRMYPYASINLFDEVMIPHQEVEIQAPTPQRYGESRLTHLFSTASQEARRFTLQVDTVRIGYQLYEYFQVDLGPEPSVGDEWRPEIVIDVDGRPMRLASARLTEDLSIGPMAVLLDLTWELPNEMDSMSISGARVISLHGPDLELPIWETSPDDNPRAYTSRTLIATQDYPMRSGILKMYISDVQMNIQGPWVISWDVPERPNPPD
jgi:hypothetical protein